MTKKKVIFLGDDFGRPTGWSIVAKNLISNLDNSWVYEAYFARGKIKEDTEIKSAGILLSYRERSKNLLIILDLISLMLNLRFSKIKTIHCLAEPYIPVAFLLAVIYRADLICTIYGTHSVIPHESKYKKIYEKAFTYAKKISCISNYTKKRFLETWGKNFSNVEVVYIGCDQKTFKHKIELEKENFFLYVGTIKERKGLLPSLLAFEKFLGDFPEYTFQIAAERGFGTQKNSEYESKVFNLAAKYPENIIFLGKISDKELVEKYRKCSANVLVSVSNEKVFEGFGMVHVEANLCGSLTIGGIDSPNEELISNGINGYLANGRDIESIFQAYKKTLSMIQNKKHHEIIQDCIIEGKRFNWESFTSWHLENY